LFVDFFIRRPVFATVCALLIILGGAISIPTLSIADFPDLAPPQVVVSSGYIGANAQTVESAVTIPLEQAINGVPGMKYITSTSGNDGSSFILATFDVNRDIDLAAVEQHLASDASITHVLSVHHATTTGRLNSVAALGALCKKYDRAFLLDGVSSFGGEDIRFEAWNLEAVAGTANKCLHGVPGISFALVKKSVFAARASGATSVYLDLWRHWKEQQGGWSPFTQSVHVVYALQEALAEMESQGGWRARCAEYARRAGLVRGVLRELGVAYFLDDGERASSSILTAFAVPAHVTYDALHDGLKARGFVIYAGQGPYLGKMFRIAVMGDLTATDLDELAAGLRAIIAPTG